jgi:hypothetical protein
VSFHRKFLLPVAAVLLPAIAGAQNFPARPIRLLVP